MPIDWSKYGVGGSSGGSPSEPKAKASVDWGKYAPVSSARADEQALSDEAQMAEAQRNYAPIVEQQQIQQADEQALSDEAQMAQAQQTYADMPKSDATELPGRNLPVIGPVFRALDAVSENPVVEKVADVGRSFYTPGATLQNVGAFTGAVESGLSRLLPRLGSTFGGRVAQEAIKEGAVGVPLGAGQSLASGNPDLQDAGKAGLISGGLGAAGGAALPLIGRGIQAAESATARGLGQAEARPSLGAAVNEFTRNVDNSRVPSYNASEPLELPTLTQNPAGGVLRAPSRVDIPEQPSRGSVADAVSAPPTQRERAPQQLYDQHDDIANQLSAAYQQHNDYLDRLVQKYGTDSLSGELTHEEDNIITELSKKSSNLSKQKEAARQAILDAEKELQAPVRAVEAAPQAVGETRLAPSQPVDLHQPSPLRTSVQEPKVTDELKFANTVRTSENTAEPLTRVLSDTPLTGSRTSDVLNRQQAEALIEKHGREGLYSKLLAKRMNFSSVENTAAQMLAKHYSSLGGEANLSKAIDLVSKTAKGGREMGQAIQALNQWNKLDAEGALLLGERQLNRGVRNNEDWQKLTPAQGAPITEAAQRIGKAQETRNLADEVLSIVTNKQSGEALTDAEKATIKQFQDQVKTINEKGKGILAKPKEGKADATIKEVSQIEPKARTRDQVVSFLDAKAEKARERLAKSRNIGLLPDLNNPVTDYAIIGASHIAKGVVKLSDFTAAMVKDFGEAIKPHINEVFTKATNIFRKENGLPTVQELDRVVNKAVKDARFSREDATKFKAWVSEIGHMSDEFKKEATQDLQMAMKELGDSTLGDKLAAVHTSGMLLNNVTFERNLLGNISQFILEKSHKLATVPVDWTLSKLTKEQRTIFFKSMNQAQFWKDFWEGTKSGWKGVSPSGTLDSYGIHPNVFKNNNHFKYLTKSLGASLQGFDYAFYNHFKGDVLATYAEQLGKAKGLNREQIKAGMKDLIHQLDDKIHELADHAGRYATYQDDTLLSKGAEFIKKGLNAPTDALFRGAENMGLPKKYSLEGFGSGDVLTKYAKTPANLIMRGLDYSPIGFIRAITQLIPLVTNRAKFNQFEASRALGRAITGSIGLTGMGFILADVGILTGSASMDKDVRSIQEQSGQGAYKVNWSALSRFILGGLDYDAAKFQKGDKLMDYAWIQPAAISVAMGVNAQKAWADRKNVDAAAGWQRYGKAILSGIGSVLENPLVQGVSQAVDAATDIVKKQDPTKLKNIGKGIPASFVPTLFNQARTATDNNQRETFNKNIFVEIGNLMKNKVPGLSKTLPVSFDSLGNAREKIQGAQADTVGQYLTAFFSPAKMTEYQVSPEAKIVLDLMNQSGDQNILPRISNRYIHISQGKNQKDLRIDLTAGQYSQLQQNVGQMVTKKLAEKAEYLSNDSISLKNKVERVKSILTDVGKKAREDIGIQMGYKKKDIKS